MGLQRCSVAEPRYDRVHAERRGPGAPARIDPIHVTYVYIVPDAAGHHVGMAFDEAGGKRMVGVGAVQYVRAPARQVVQCARAEDPPVTDRDMRGGGLAPIEG